VLYALGIALPPYSLLGTKRWAADDATSLFHLCDTTFPGSNQFLILPTTMFATAVKSLGINGACVLCLPTSYRTSPSCLTSALKGTMPTDKGDEIDTGSHEPAVQSIDIKTSSKSDEGRPAVLNQPTNVNNVSGPVQTIHNNNYNYNHVTNISQADFFKEIVRFTGANRAIR